MSEPEPTAASRQRKCPVCGQGDLVDVDYREDAVIEDKAGEEVQSGESRQVESYSCGHEVVGPALDRTAAGTDRLEVERRESDETAEPI